LSAAIAGPPLTLTGHPLRLPLGQIPGTYEAGKPVLKIGSFVQTLSVISSKQRPRKLTILADDGSPQLFLLKGHEDLRQDERVMQLFGLINDLLATDRKADGNRDLAIQVGCRGWAMVGETGGAQAGA
jgi:phosphatidylinositol kinase/protein kinase (PI-3  family)